MLNQWKIDSQLLDSAYEDSKTLLLQFNQL